jgi:tripartite-type tricarboxylate transporter receptor subunit TctC
MTSLLKNAATAIALAGSSLAFQAAHAAYPDKPITIVFPYASGSASDALTRMMGEILQKAMGQPVIVESRPGAGGSIATEHVVRAAPDGYTLAFTGSGTVSVNPHIYKLRYNPIDDLAQISIAVEVPFVFVVKKGFPAQDLKSFVALAKAHPGTITSANPGLGTQTQLTQAAFTKLAGIDLNVLAYKGSAPAVNDLLGGHVDSMMDNAVSQIPYIKAQNVTALYVSSDYRFEGYPDVPTAKEAGIEGLVPAGWFGLAAPKGTPPEVVDKINAALVAGLKQADTQKKLQAMGWVVVADSPQEATQRARSDYDMLGKTVRDINLKLD